MTDIKEGSEKKGLKTSFLADKHKVSDSLLLLNGSIRANTVTGSIRTDQKDQMISMKG